MIRASHDGKPKPYTEIGVRRMACFRCGRAASSQWSICSLGNRYFPLCARCDRTLNAVVLRFMRYPNVEGVMAGYRPDGSVSPAPSRAAGPHG